MSKTLTRTICIKLDVDGHEVALQETQKCFNEAATWIASICWQEHITNTNKDCQVLEREQTIMWENVS